MLPHLMLQETWKAGLRPLCGYSAKVTSLIIYAVVMTASKSKLFAFCIAGRVTPLLVNMTAHCGLMPAFHVFCGIVSGNTSVPAT